MINSNDSESTQQLRKLNTILDLNKKVILSLLDTADVLENYKAKLGHLPEFLKGRVLALVFDETSMRTRNAFERGMIDLGGGAICLNGADVRFGRHAQYRENITDFVNVVGGFNDVLLCRVYDHVLQGEVAKLSRIPFINGMCDRHHPTQALCDFLTIRRKLGRLEGVRIAFVGDSTNVARSLAQVASFVGAKFRISTPKQYAFPLNEVEHLSGYEWVEDPRSAVLDADVVIGDVWVPMNKHHQAEERRRVLFPYQINKPLMALAKPHAFFMHNLPANRGDEVSAEIIDGAQSAIYEEAISRLHIARALLLQMLRPDYSACIRKLIN